MLPITTLTNVANTGFPVQFTDDMLEQMLDKNPLRWVERRGAVEAILQTQYGRGHADNDAVLDQLTGLVVLATEADPF